MAEVTAPEPVDPNTGVAATATAVDMDVEKLKQKRDREEGEDDEPKEEANEDDAVSKKQKVEEEEEKSVEEQRMEKLKESSEAVKLGPKSFASSLEMFNYFYNFLQVWPHYLNINKFEHLVLLELLKKGHAEPDKKIGVGIRAFQVRKHDTFKSRCFFLIREDDSVDDFSFRKCVDHILPLPDEMHLKLDQNKSSGGGGGGGGRHYGGKGGRGRGGKGGHGHGRGGKWRH